MKMLLVTLAAATALCCAACGTTTKDEVTVERTQTQPDGTEVHQERTVEEKTTVQ